MVSKSNRNLNLIRDDNSGSCIYIGNITNDTTSSINFISPNHQNFGLRISQSDIASSLDTNNDLIISSSNSIIFRSIHNIDAIVMDPFGNVSIPFLQSPLQSSSLPFNQIIDDNENKRVTINSDLYINHNDCLLGCNSEGKIISVLSNANEDGILKYENGGYIIGDVMVKNLNSDVKEFIKNQINTSISQRQNVMIGDVVDDTLNFRNNSNIIVNNTERLFIDPIGNINIHPNQFLCGNNITQLSLNTKCKYGFLHDDNTMDTFRVMNNSPSFGGTLAHFYTHSSNTSHTLLSGEFGGLTSPNILSYYLSCKSANGIIGGIVGTGLSPGTGINTVAFLYASSQTIKKNITMVPDDYYYNFIKNSNNQTYTFNYIGDELNIHTETGFIAQEFKKVFPQLVHGSEEEPIDNSGHKSYMSIDYSRITPVLYSCIKDCIAHISSNEERVILLDERVTLLDERLRILNEKLGLV